MYTGGFHPPDPQGCMATAVQWALGVAVERMWPEGLRVVPSLEARGQRGCAKHSSIWKLQDLSQSLCWRYCPHNPLKWYPWHCDEHITSV